MMKHLTVLSTNGQLTEAVQQLIDLANSEESKDIISETGFGSYH